MTDKEKIITLLQSTNREGMDNMIQWMEIENFFTSPGSTKYHGCYEGGLAKHSLGVYSLLHSFNQELQLGCEEDSIIIATLLHDVCKVGAYLGDHKPYQYNRSQPKGHARLSIERIEQFIMLSPLKKLMILYHMGPWNSTGRGEEYSVDDMLSVWGKNEIVRWVYFSDEMATREEKVDES